MNRSQNNQRSPENGAWRQLAGGLLGGMIVLATIVGSVILATQEAPRLPTPVGMPSLTPSLEAGGSPAPLETPSPSLTPERGDGPTAVATSDCVVPADWSAYTVRSGDTLFSVAAAAGVNVFALIQGNCLAETELTPGQVIYLPPSPTPGPTAAPTRCGPPPGHWVQYVVRSGDTLYGLSVRYGSSVSALAEANCLATYTLRVGQSLRVPPLPTPFPTWPSSPLATATPWPYQPPSATPLPEHTPTASPTEPTATPTDTPFPVTPTLTPQATDTLLPTGTAIMIPTTVTSPTDTPIPSATVAR